MTAGSPERRGLTQAGAAVGDSHRPERIEAGRPQEQGSSKDSKWAGGYILAGERSRSGLGACQRLPCAQMEAYTQELRPNSAAACGAASAGTFRSQRKPRGCRDRERVKGKHRQAERGPHGSGPASPSHGKLDHGESGARAAQLRLEIRVAPDWLHSHHSQRARKGGRDATGLEAEREDRERKGEGSGKPRPERRR